MKGKKPQREVLRPEGGDWLRDLIIPSQEQIWGLLLVLAALIALIFSLPE